jgi:hypothetical protein
MVTGSLNAVPSSKCLWTPRPAASPAGSCCRGMRRPRGCAEGATENRDKPCQTSDPSPKSLAPTIHNNLIAGSVPCIGGLCIRSAELRPELGKPPR